MSSILRSMKDIFPFRLGTTSYILADDLVANVEFLGPLVDDVELVLFESAELSNLPDADIIATLVELKCLRRLSYTVHLPVDVRLGDPDEIIRKRSVEKCLKVVNMTKPLHPNAYIVHFDGEIRGRMPAGNMDRWVGALDHSAAELLSSGVEANRFCIETLEYPFEHVAHIVLRHGLSVCLDVGHLAFYGFPIRDCLERYLAQCRVIHLHGHVNGTDHKGIDLLDSEILFMLMECLGSTDENKRVLTVEVFGIEDFAASMEIMRGLKGRINDHLALKSLSGERPLLKLREKIRK